MFDSHCHLTFKEFEGRTQQILDDARAVGVRGAITVATTSADCLRAIALAESHEDLWCSAGVHPLHSDEALNWDDVRTAAASPKCVAWGELGLDNHYKEPARDVQLMVLDQELALIASLESGGSTLAPDTRESKRPIIVHCRDAFDDLLAIFRTTSFEPHRFVFHCFTGTPDDARKVLDFGAWISFTGVVTFANAPEVAAAAKLAPADRIMVETDAPFLSPEPVRKIRPNEPKNVVHIARRIAELRGVRYEDLEQQLDSNVERFFGIKINS